jgi:hypothetical protein
MMKCQATTPGLGHWPASCQLTPLPCRPGAAAAELSVPLKTELVLFLYRDALHRIPFFRNKDTQFIASVVTHLRLDYFSAVGAALGAGRNQHPLAGRWPLGSAPAAGPWMAS